MVDSVVVDARPPPADEPVETVVVTGTVSVDSTIIVLLLLSDDERLPGNEENARELLLTAGEGGVEGIAVTGAAQEHADEIRDGEPTHCET